MKNRKRMLALMLFLALAVSLCACSSANGDATASPDPSASPDPTAAPTIEVDLTLDAVAFASGLSGDDVLLTVNGEDVAANLFLYLLFLNCNEFEYYYYYYGLTVADYADMLLEDTVYMLEYYTVCRQKANELGCLLTDEQQAELEAKKTEEYAEAYEQEKAVFGLTDEDVDFIPVHSYYYSNLLDAVTHEPSEQELAEYVDDEGIFYVKHILLMTVDQSTYEPLSEDKIKEKKALAEDLLARLQAAEGEEQLALFDELMNTYSEDGGLTTNPDGYVFDNDDSLVDGFREAALELEAGQLSGIVETDYGYHIMLRLALTDEMEESCRTYLRQIALEDQMTQWMETLETVRADALADLDVADFYNRYFAYYDAFMEQYEAANGAD